MKSELSLKYSHNIIDHLGLKLYQNKPTNVIAELVSNSYDADAENVWINLGENQITISDDGLGMTLDDLKTKYLIIGKQKRAVSNLNELSPNKKRKFMGRKGIGKLAPFGIARKVSVLTISQSEKLINWFSIDLNELLESTEKNDGEVESYTPEIIADNLSIESLQKTLDKKKANILENFLKTSSKSGTMIVLDNLTLNKEIPETKLIESMGRRFTVTLLKPDFKVIINDKTVDEEAALPKFDFRFPEKGYDTEIISINGHDREIKHWCGFVGKAKWSQDESGVGIYAHGKIAQDRPFVFGVKGSEITTRYMYAVIEADWIDELPTEFISTDRTSINWEDEETSEFYEWGSQTVKKWTKKFQDEKNKKNEEKVLDKLDNPSLPPITSAEKESIKKIVCEMSPKVTNDDKLQEEVISKLASAWLHEPSKKMIEKLWNRLPQVEDNKIEFTIVLDEIHKHLVSEALSVSSTTAQKIYALSKLHYLSRNGIEDQLQILLDYFPWIINSEYTKFYANRELRTLAKEALELGYIPAHGHIKDALEAEKDKHKERPDLCFFQTEKEDEFLVVELKNPQNDLTGINHDQLYSYMRWLEDKFPNAKVRGYLIGKGASKIKNHVETITVLDWHTLCLESRQNYLVHLAAMIEGAKDIANPERVYKVFDLAGAEAKELLRRMGNANSELKSLMDRIDKEIDAKATKKGKKS